MTRRRSLIIVSCLVALFTSQEAFSGTSPIESLVPKVAPDGWVLKDAPETFTRETLFEHIDGQADLFLQYGFEKSAFVMYRKPNSPDDIIELDIYDMGNALQAFGVFSRFRYEDRPVGIGLDSFVDDLHAFFYKGKYFVVLQATESNASTLKRLAEEIGSRISDKSAPPKELAFFPKGGLKPGAIEYYPEGLLGHQFLKRGFKASYLEKAGRKTESEGGDFHLFLSVLENSQEAVNALRLFSEYLSKNGRVVEGVSTKFGPNALIGVDPYQGKTIVANKGTYLVGAVGFENDQEGEQRLAELMNKVK